MGDQNMKFYHFFLTTILILIFLTLGINKVAYLFYQSVGLAYFTPVEISFFEGILEIRFFELTTGLDLGYIAEISRERLESILSWKN